MKPLAIIYQIFVINELFGFAAFIALHVYRFSFSGRYCSGDLIYMWADSQFALGELIDDTTIDAMFEGGVYLRSRGHYLEGLAIYTWVIGFVMVLYTYALHVTAYKTYEVEKVERRILGLELEVKDANDVADD